MIARHLCRNMLPSGQKEYGENKRGDEREEKNCLPKKLNSFFTFSSDKKRERCVEKEVPHNSDREYKEREHRHRRKDRIFTLTEVHWRVEKERRNKRNVALSSDGVE